MKVNNKCVKNMCVLLPILLLVGCNSQTQQVIPEEYPELYEAVMQRDAAAIMAFTDHSDEETAAQSWRAMISTPVEEMDEFIKQVKQTNRYVAWKALSRKELTAQQLDVLHADWLANPELREGISLVLGLQGNEKSLQLLVEHFEDIQSSTHEFESALATGRLIGQFGLETEMEDNIIAYALSLNDEILTRAWLYGYYRDEQPIHSTDAITQIREAYSEVENPRIRQYLLSLSFQNIGQEMLGDIEVATIEDMDVQLATELAQHTDSLEWSDKLEKVYTALLNHPNPIVNEVTLSMAGGNEDKPDIFDEVIINKIVENENKDAALRLSAVMALEDASAHKDLVDELAEAGDYLLTKQFSIYRTFFSNSDFYALASSVRQSENRRETLSALRAINRWWSSLDPKEKEAIGIDEIRKLVFEVLESGDRSMTFSISSLLNDAAVIQAEDYQKLHQLLNAYQLPEDVAVFQAVAGVLKTHFEEKAKPLIDSLAAIGNTDLNRTLYRQDWDVPETEEDDSPVKFRKPGWERLNELGSHPVWVLETTRGTIKVEMNVRLAPATISGMDSLITAGAYDHVAYHRVVPNFVVQGGDVGTGDGSGGPDYTVPTEASEIQYWRGQVGIASAGTDTEGSQYFFMHQWKPHLNARYTIVGSVIEGIEAVDRMMVGDKVLRSYWE